MLRRILCTVGLVVAVGAVSTGVANADVQGGLFGSDGAYAPDQNGLININAPLVDARCLAPWFGSAVLGGSLPIGEQAIVCDDVKAPITETHNGDNGLLG
jgi:hypothetical protein